VVEEAMKAILLLTGATLLSAGVDRWTPLGPDGGGASLLSVPASFNARTRSRPEHEKRVQAFPST
jgi:hypothetical protein